jgi:Putative beta barrel porin-7 (BBP7)
MTNSTRSIGLIMTAVLWAATAAAQGPAMSDWNDATPPELTLPPRDAETLPAPPGQSGGDRTMLSKGPMLEEDRAAEGYLADEYSGFAPGLHEHWKEPAAPIESTGTWIRRGFWYAEAEAVIWNRHWNRDDVLYAAQDQQVQDPTFFSRFNPTRTLFTNRALYVDGAHPGQDTSVRGTLGHFLFRDSKNRDHTIEFTAFGGGDWVQDRVITSTVPFGLFVPFYIDGANRSFDQSSRQTISYSSNYSSFEGNYRVRQRMERDRLIMDANGNWHRSAKSGFVREYLVGLRLVESRDIFDWRAEDIQVVGNDGAYLIRTDNDMVGFQLGTGITYEHGRWSLGVNSKGGVYINDALGQTSLDFSADDNQDADLRLVEDQLSFIGEARIQGRWHVTPNFSLRAAYELMYLTSQALAPNQATFITEFSYLNTSQDPFYHGASFGFEGYW